MAKHWDYATTPGSSHGLMVCTACNKPITEGQYRVCETDKAYFTQHRACSTSDPKWALLDKEASHEEKQATLTMRLKAESGYSSEETHRIGAEQWAEIQFICADGPERETMRAAIAAE